MAKAFLLSELSDKHELILKIKDVLSKATKQTIAFIAVDKMQKKAGVATKNATFSFEEGQTLTLVFRADGDVIQTKMNNKVLPLNAVMDYDKMDGFIAALEDLALKIKGNQEKFNKKRFSARVVIPKTKAPALTVKKRITQAKEAIEEIEKGIEQKKEAVNKKLEELNLLKQISSASGG